MSLRYVEDPIKQEYEKKLVKSKIVFDKLNFVRAGIVVSPKAKGNHNASLVSS